MKCSCNKDAVGKLIIRAVLGILFAAKGIKFFIGGKTALIAFGKILSTIGITFWPLYFGWILACICVVCGMTLLLGVFFKTTTFLLGTILLLDTICKYYMGYRVFDAVAYSAMIVAVMYGMMFIGAGEYSVQKSE